MKSRTSHRLIELDRRYIWHPFTQMKGWLKRDPTLIVAGKGPYVYDLQGKRYLDANSSIWTNIHGHRHPHLDAAVRKQLRKIAHSSFLGLTHEPASLLAEKLIRLAPKGLKKVFFSDDGSTAIEAALKMSYQFWRQQAPRPPSSRSRKLRSRFLSLGESYHGDTVGAMSLGGIDLFFGTYKDLVFKGPKVMSPYCYRCPFNRSPPDREDARETRRCQWECLSLAEQTFQRHHHHLAAAVIEPVIQGAAGMIVHPHGYLKRFAQLCKSQGCHLIADEIMTGFGRTGTLFACEQEKVSPNFLCLAKGLSGGYSPLAATLVTQSIFDGFLGKDEERNAFYHGHSYTGHPLGCAAALASLEIFEKEQTLRRVSERSLDLQERLRTLWKIPIIGDIRQVGLIAGIELVKNWRTREPFPWQQRTGARVCELAKQRGVLTRPIGDVIVIMPPLCITSKQIDDLVDALEFSLTRIDTLSPFP